MPNTIIADTSPLISLAKIGRLDLLQKNYGEIYIPQMVLDEVNTIPDNAASLINNSSWIKALQIQNFSDRLNFPTKDLHAGEIDAMILYKEISANLFIVDDHAARDYAYSTLHYNITGTIGVLVKSKTRGFITSLKPEFINLMNNQFFTTKAYLNNLLLANGETIIS